MDVGEIIQTADGLPQTISSELIENSTELTTKTGSSSGQSGESETTSGLTIPLNNSKTLKRCLSVPILRAGPSFTSMTTRAAAAAMAMRNAGNTANSAGGNNPKETLSTPIRHHTCNKHEAVGDVSTANNFGHNIHIGIPRSNPSSREVSPAPVFNIFAPRARRYSASYTPHGAAGVVGNSTAVSGLPLCLTPRVSQLRQEECVDMLNTREANHEREVHSAMQMSQSWEDLTLVAENWSCKSEDLSNPLQVSLPSGITSCSSPSPTNNRAGMRLPYGLSPSPTRRTFATRRSMSPIAMRPSQLGPVKRKFELDEGGTGSNWNVYSQPPLKKIFTESRGSSPVCQSPSSICPSPDSGTYDGRITPKLFISKLCTNNTNNNSACSSPSSSVSGGIIDSTITSGICSSGSSTTSSISGGSEPMCIGNGGIDEGISVTENNEKLTNNGISTTNVSSGCSVDTNTAGEVQTMTTDIQDDATLLDDMKSETSSIGGCSSISIESSSCDSVSKAAASFLNRLNVDDISTSPLAVQKSFYINKQGLTGNKKFIVSSVSSEPTESINVTSTNVNSSTLTVSASDIIS